MIDMNIDFIYLILLYIIDLSPIPEPLFPLVLSLRYHYPFILFSYQWWFDSCILVLLLISFDFPGCKF